MQAHQFDRITKLLTARRVSRRAALQGSAAAGAAGLLSHGLATAQEATPVTDEERLAFLFLQSFESGNLVPAPAASPTADGGAAYTLTLNSGLGETLFFSDRPERIVGTVPTPTFLDALGFTPANPPNAALVADKADGDQDVLVLELFNPRYDETTRTATYDVHILQNDARVDMTFVEEPQLIAEEERDYTGAHLFIDDCPDTTYCCYTASGDMAGYTTDGTCWSWKKLDCLPCRDYSDVCNATFPDACQGNCTVGNCR
jgi:hypothetical protein